MKSNEAYLVKLIGQHDHSAYEYLCQQCSSALMSTLLKTVRNEETARRLLGDLFSKLWKNIGAVPQRARLYTWMQNEARRMGMDYVRSAKSRNTIVN